MATSFSMSTSTEKANSASASASAPQPKRLKSANITTEKDGKKDEDSNDNLEQEWRIYHPKKQKSFQVGDQVIVLGKGRNSNHKINSENSSFLKLGTIVEVGKHEVQVALIENENDSNANDNNSSNDPPTPTPPIPSSGESKRFSKKEWKRLVPNFLPTITAATIQQQQQRKQMIVVTPETNYFRQLAYQIKSNDKVLEIGCSSGETSRVLMTLAHSWVGLDTSDEMIEMCQQKIQKFKAVAVTIATTTNKNEDNNSNSQQQLHNIHVAKADALVDPGTALKEATVFGDPTVVFIDIGGNRECINVVRMLSWTLDTFSSSFRLIVVKSRELVQSIESSATDTGSTTTIITKSVQDGYIITNGNQWFVQQKQTRQFPKHPLRAPLVLSPKDGKTPICRYHNYHKRGCFQGDECELDHEYCHACQQIGHTAKECPTFPQNKPCD